MPLVGVVLGLLPGFTWLFFYLQEEVHPEPKRLIAVTFVSGAAFAFLALAVQLGLRDVYVRGGFGQESLLWLFSFAAVEELMKFWAAYAAIHKSPEFDEPVDAMLYVIIAALGFATVENIGVLFGSPITSVFLPASFHIITFRFVGATLLHTLASGILGYHWALGIRDFHAPHHLISGLIAATVIHGTFNFLVLNFGERGFAITFLIIVAFFVFADFEKLKARML